MASGQGSYASGQYATSGGTLGASVSSAMQQRSSDSNAAPPTRQQASSQHLNPQDQQNAARTRSGSNSKQLLTMALVEAQNAVQLDNASDIHGALEAYKRAVALLARVMETSPSEDEQERLKTIHDSYLFRIRLLSTPVPGPSSSVSAAASHTSTAADDQGSHASVAPLDKPPVSATSTSLPGGTASAAATSTATGAAVVQDHPPRDINQPSSHEESDTSTLAMRRAKKPAPTPIMPAIPPPPPAATAPHAPPPVSDARTPRQRSGSTASADVRPPRNHTRTHTGGSTRGPGDIISAAEQLQMHAQQRLPGSANGNNNSSTTQQMRRVKSREHLIPFHSAPTAPLPPPPSTPPPLPQIPSGTTSPVKSPSSPVHSNPSTPSLSMPAMFNSIPISPPPRSPLPQVPNTLTSPPPSPANQTRRVSPLAPSNLHPPQPPQHPRVSPPPPTQPPPPQPSTTSTTTSASSSSAPKASVSQEGTLEESHLQSQQQQQQQQQQQSQQSQQASDQFYDELENVADEWLPNLSEKDFDKSMAEQLSLEPLPREGITSRSSLSSVISDLQIPARTNSKNMGNRSSKEDLRQQLRASAGAGGNVQRSRSPVMHHSSQQQQQQHSFSQHHHQHQRSQSQSSLLQSSQPVSSRTSPLYSLQGGTASISSLHALDPTTGTYNYKRISDSARSFKESPLGQSLPIGPGSGPSSPVLRSSPARFDTSTTSASSSPASSNVNQHSSHQQQASSHLASSNSTGTNANASANSKLSSPHTGSGALSNATSPTMGVGIEKERSPSLGGGVSGGQTLMDVLAEDPFAGMSFPPPPPYIEPPPADPYLRCFWLMRKLEQSMTTGGFVTRRMYVPRSVWFQSQVRIPAADPKIAACQGLTTGLNKMWQQSQRGSLNLMIEAGGGAEGDQERAQLLKELDALEQIANQMQAKLAKKLSFIQRPGKHSSSGGGGGLGLTIATAGHHQMYQNGEITAGLPTGGGNRMTMMFGDGQSFDWATEDPMPSSQQQQSPPTGGAAQFSPPPQTPTTAAFSDKKKSAVSIAGASDNSGLKGQWKSFSKSVQKSIVNDKLDDTFAYTDAVIHLFQASYFLEMLLRHYNSLGPYQTHLQIVNRLRRLCDFLSLVVCGFVIRDMGELMGKYVKRVGAWVAE
ncbi:hypothetical protein BGW42_000435 [Actinomortierella wolfii]|nr:hypothetical protein BGW42_000435 [Actinomortierella wolfii]